MKKLNLLGKKYSVKLKKTDDENNAAEYCTIKREIVINPESERKMHSLGHELGHIFWDETGMAQIKEIEKIEEIFCELLGLLLEDNIVILYQMHNKLEKKPKRK